MVVSRKGVLPYHVDTVAGEERVICWCCRTRGEFDRRKAAKGPTKAVLVTGGNPINAMRIHRSRRHKGAAEYPHLVDMTVEMARFQADDTYQLHKALTQRAEEALSRRSLELENKRLQKELAAKDKRIMELERQVSQARETPDSDSQPDKM